MRKILGYLILLLMALVLFAGMAAELGILEAAIVWAITIGAAVAFAAAVHLIHSQE